MRSNKRVLIVMLTLILTVGMSSTSVFAAVQAKSITITTPSLKTYTMDVGKSKTFQVKVNPSKLSKQVTWTSSQKSVATVTTKGKVTAKKAGKTTITAKAGKKSAKVTVTVQIPVKSLKIAGKKEISVGDKVQFKASVSPSNATNKTIKWSSTNAKAATVSSKGQVTAVKPGTAVIKASSANKKTASYTVNVIAKSDLPMTAEVKRIQAKADDQYAKKVTEQLAYEIRDDATGFITAGSDAEKEAADYLASEFKAIGLSDVEKVPVTVDKWQFNDASLSLRYKDKDGEKTLELTNKNKEIVSYASSGTVQLKEKVDWNNLEIIDLGEGLEADYKGIDVKDKIVLVSVNQSSDFWIDAPYMEAYQQGAAAIITYQSGGYGEYNPGYPDRKKWDTINVQDICAEDLQIPCLSISPANADKILAAIKAHKENGGNVPISAALMADNLIEKDSTAYNVIGKIKGTENTGQQILYAGHYDKYFEGYQDDAAAVGLTAGIAKAMIDSGFKPANDIIFIAHCAEEWGQSGTSTDWAIGSWKMITEAKPEWKGKTLAIINFESPAIIPSVDFARMSATREITSTLTNFVDSGLMKGTENKVFTKPLQGVSGDGYAMTDGVSYQFNGVPVIDDNTPRALWQSMVSDKPVSHAKSKYHTQYDNVDTYSPDVMNYKIKAFASAGAYIDGTPALEMSLDNRCDVLEKSIEGNVASLDQKNAFMRALDEMKTEANNYQNKVKAVNKQYMQAYQNGESSKTLAAIRDEAEQLNTKTLQIFQKFQDAFVGLSDYSTVEPYHKGLENNINILDEVIAALESGNPSQIEEAQGVVGGLWSDYEYYALSFSDQVCERSANVVTNKYLKERNITNWGDRMTMMIPTYKTTKDMDTIYTAGKTKVEDYEKVIADYKEVRNTLKAEFDKKMQEETQDMTELVKFLQ